MIRELTPADGQIHVYDDVRVLIVKEPSLIRLHHKACGGLLLPVALSSDIDMAAVAALFEPCRCRKSQKPVDRAALVAEVYSHLYHAIQKTCQTADDVLRLLERLSSPSRLKQFYHE